MGIEFNAFEIFEIAEQIERNAVRFYRKAAELFDKPKIRSTLLELAEWETKHEEIFAEMRKQLSEESSELRSFEPESDMSLYLEAMAGSNVFDTKTDPLEELSGIESKENIFKKAIEKEKDSIAYYLGLKEFVSAKAGKAKIDDVIKEEMRHIGILNQSLELR